MEIIPVFIEKEIGPDDDISSLISSAQTFEDNDILVIAQKIISKREGRLIRLDTVEPSLLAEGLASQYQKDPRIVELILQESKKIIRMQNGVIIVETKQGFVCANAGIDESNVPDGYATLLPEDSDKSAQKVQSQILQKTGKKIAVIVSDTFGRPFRIGQTNHAIGSAGINLILDYEGTKDSFGRTLRVTAIAIVDELCGAAELVMRKNEKCPAAIIRNYSYQSLTKPISEIIRPKEQDLFR